MEIDGANVIKRAAEAGDVDVQGESRKRSRIHNVPVESDSNAGVEEARNEASAQETAEFSKDVPGPSQKKELKQKKNAGRRRGTRREPESVTENGQDSAEKEPRLPKRLCALLIGYSGSGYNGMQIQPDVRTIEGTLFKALVQAGAVSKDNADDPVKVGLQRAARTDAGVHAAGNVVSMKIITNVPGVSNLITRINEELPPEIRLWNFHRVQGSFNARMSCDSRKYTYFFPSYLLIPPKPGSGMHRSFKEQAESTDESMHPFWKDCNGDSSHEDDLLRKRKWRASPEEVERLRSTVAKYLGTHNFHNFTIGRDYKDRSCQRHMKTIEISDPVCYGDTEWISVMLHGQSFMLHQRKMMTVLIMAVRTGTPSRIIEELYGSRTVVIPKMPSLGLLLEHPVFDSYNIRVREKNKGLKESDADFRPELDFTPYNDQIHQFKDEQIYSRMRASEDRVAVFDRWVRSIDCYSGPDLRYFNSHGDIPESAVFKRGERRSNPFKEKKRFDATDFPLDVPSFVDDDEAEDIVDEEKELLGISKKDLAEADG